MAYRAGAVLVNMEFIQIGPASVKTQLNCSGLHAGQSEIRE